MGVVRRAPAPDEHGPFFYVTGEAGYWLIMRAGKPVLGTPSRERALARCEQFERDLRDELEQRARVEDERAERWLRRRAAEDERATHYGYKRGADNCQSCGSFRSSPTTACPLCGDTRATHNATRKELCAIERAHGFRG